MGDRRPGKGLPIVKHNLPDPFTTDASRKTFVASNRPSIFSNAGAWLPSQNTDASMAAPRPSPSSSLKSPSRRGTTHTAPILSSDPRRLYLPAIQWSLPVAYMYPYSKYREYLRQRLNVRVHIDPILEIFPRNTTLPARTSGFLGTRILAHLDMKSLLLAQRVRRYFNNLITLSPHLQRRLWFLGCSDQFFPDLREIDQPNFLDPLIEKIRAELDLFYHYDPQKMIQVILYAPARGKVSLFYALEASWQKMLVMRSAEKQKYWRVVLPPYGHINMGVFDTAPTFGQIIDAIIDVVTYGGRKYKVILPACG